MSRKVADKRRLAHNILANHILSLGLDVRVETMNFKGLQAKAKKTEVSEKTGRFKRKKRFGKSLANRAPCDASFDNRQQTKIFRLIPKAD